MNEMTGISMKWQKLIKKVTKLIMLTLIYSSLFVGVTACNNDDSKTQGGNRIYYVNQEEKKITSEEYRSEEKDATVLMSDYLEKLTKNGKEKGNFAAIPSEIEINQFDITDGIATVDFSETYSKLSVQREVLCRSAVVFTLTQIDEVEYVAFTVNEVPLRQKDGKLVGTMKASDFVADLGGGINTYATADFTLFFANSNGSMLKEYKLMDAKYGEKSKERFIVEQLIEGPKEKGYTATLSSNLKLINIVTANNICYVDFEENFLTEQSEVANELVIFSIVNSLSELNEIHKVQISVNGDSMVKYHDEIPLTEPFIRNLDLIEE